MVPNSSQPPGDAPAAELPDGVHRIVDCDIRCTSRPWPFELSERSNIQSHWRQRSSEHPNFYNGRVFIMVAGELQTDRFTGTLVETDFAASLYWRETGFRDTTVLDCFGSAIIISSDGALIYGRQAPGNVNSGLCYPPAGFIDRADIDQDGRCDVDGSIERELQEETGLNPADLDREAGYLLTRDGPLLSVSVVFRSAKAAAQLVGQISGHMALEAVPELSAIVPLFSKSDVPVHPMLVYARRLAEHFLPD